jgi:hypothetical protein
MLKETQINNIADELGQFKGTQRSFEAFRLLRQSEYKPFKMADAEGNTCNNQPIVCPTDGQRILRTVL